MTASKQAAPTWRVEMRFEPLDTARYAAASGSFAYTEDVTTAAAEDAITLAATHAWSVLDITGYVPTRTTCGRVEREETVTP